VDPDGIITTIAGNGTTEDTEDDVPATSTSLNRPWGVTLDETGTLYIADTNNNRVRTVSPDGIITTIAGNGTTENTEDNVPATSTSLNRPNGVSVDRAGNLYIAENYGHRVRGVTGVARMAPALTPAADLYGEVVSPFRVQRGQEFDLGARIRNRGPNPADGQYVTVVLTLAEGLVGGPGTTGRRLARTFTGQQLPPHQGTLDGVLRACAPESTLPGIYECTLEIQYSGDLNLKNNTYPLPITVVAPAPVADEKALTVYQDTLADVAPGQHTAFTMRFTSPADQPVNPGTITQRYTAPSGFVFSGQPTYAYYETIDGVIAGNLDHRIEDGGRTLIITANPHVNTSTSDNGSLIYIIPVQARHDAVPGRYDDGSASIGHHTPVQISGKITGAGQDETALRVRQESVPAASPGQSVNFNLEIRSLDNQPVNPGTIEQRITAPTGFAFTGAASFGYYGAKPYITGNLDAHIEDGGKILVIRSNPHLNTGTSDKSPLIHTLTVRALPDATPGTQPNDGRAAIGSLTPVSLTGRIL
ncbi:hypothetical protein, partial [Streptomyces syringium]|uniref:hypothetical protein n=1 Tax=Streptomyces syringium TaxID=76729 RepID=UPI0033E9C7F9